MALVVTLAPVGYSAVLTLVSEHRAVDCFGFLVDQLF